MPVALQRYLQRHIEPELPQPPATPGRWQHILVVPLYSESPSVLAAWRRLGAPGARVLVIAVLNRPENSDPRCNQAFRDAVAALSEVDPPVRSKPMLKRLSATADLLLHDLEKLRGPCPRRQGVGLARKTGCDIALAWMNSGAVAGDWICSSDADAILPGDYFRRLPATARGAPVAVTYPFRHLPGGDQGVDGATALYELRLHHYVRGLERAASPYAYHTLGSCLAVNATAYAQVRGFPRRAAGEDFYLLNKVAKTGPIARLDGACIALRSRTSSRVPFGTGPAVSRIGAGPLESQRLFYHPQLFQALQALLASAASFFQPGENGLRARLLDAGLPAALSDAAAVAAAQLGWDDAMDHCRSHGRGEEQFLRHFHQWFDGFRTLKFIHGLRTAGWEDQTLADLAASRAGPRPADGEIIRSLTEADRHWGWRPPPATLFTDPRRCDPVDW